MKTPEKTGRKIAANSGKWRPGETGNPRGRPKGSGKVAALREGIAKDVPAILKAMIAKAIGGDAAAARLVLERVLPPLKPAELAVPLALPAGAGLTAQGEAIVSAMASGEIAPAQAAALLAGLGALARIKELDEMEARIRRLEGIPDAIEP